MSEQVSKTKRKPQGAAAMGAGPGRPKGCANKTTTALKEAILLAAEKVGEDGKGKHGLTGYLIALATQQPKSFAGLLGRVLPLTLQGTGPNGELLVKGAADMTDDELAAIAKARGAVEP